MSDLAAFELRDTDHTDLFGVFLAVHAIPGAVLLLHTTVGCKFKTQMHLVEHDWFRPSHDHRLWTGVDDLRLIQGSGERLLNFAETWYERRRPDLFVVTTNTAVELSAFDVEAAVARMRERLPCPVILLKAPGYEGSLYRGYRKVMIEVMRLMDWDRPCLEDSVGIVGYLFDRYEMDHAANLTELRRLFSLLGLRVPGILLSGEGLQRLSMITEAKTLACLPYSRTSEQELRSFTGRQTFTTDLPVGFAGTAAFLKTIGEALGIPKAKVEAVIDRELSRAVPLVAPVVSRLKGIRIGLALDTNTAAAVAAWLSELGIDIPVVCLTDGDDASEKAFYAAAERAGAVFRKRPMVLAGESRNRMLRALHEAAAEAPMPIIIGSSFQQLHIWGGWVVVELGYPSVEKHWPYPMPWMGFNGAVALVQRICDAVGRAF